MRAKLTSLLFALSTITLSSVSYAQMPVPDANITTPPTTQSYLIPSAPSLNVKSYVLMDAATGHVIASDNPDARLEPASLTKLMTLYLVFSAIQQGTISLDDNVRISEKAWHTGGSRMFIKAGDEVSVANLIQGVAVDSGNDASVALAEHVAGSEPSFVDMMNIAAKQLGMTHSHFVDATGLPHDDHYSTAHDLSLLTRAIITQFPDEYHYFSEKWFTYADIRQPNRNRLLWRYKGADGLKTGHTDSAGYCLVSSAQRDGMRLISVIMGATSDEARSADSIRLLTYGFRFFTTDTVFDEETPLSTVTVWKGEDDDVELGLDEPLIVTLPTGSKNALKTNIQTPNGIEAPVKEGNTYGSVSVTLNGKVIQTAPLVALDDNDKGGAWSSLSGSIHMLLDRWFGDDAPKAPASPEKAAPATSSAEDRNDNTPVTADNQPASTPNEK